MILILLIIGAIELFIMYKILEQFINKPKLNNNELNFVFAPPGCGKTTFLAYLACQVDKYNKKKRNIRRNKHINLYSNIDLEGIDYIKINKDMFGKYNISDGIILYDESSIDFNNRSYKSLPHEAIEYFKLHRHYNITMYCFSQSFDDVDITLRRLCTKYFLLKKPFHFKLTKLFYFKSIKKFIDIQKDTKQIIDAYEFKFLGKFTCNARKYFKYFNSYSRPMKLKQIK